ncbi:hypothetical protein MycrhDRAFT_5759 [Mycolicibacterium rhodesiae JS60]|nr:hypothetical protein MycrhDRAFT_5759 [Mycolicibacterium rhodesiae JS60]
MTTPNSMPKKAGLHLQILGSLLKRVPASWTQKSIDPNSPDPNKPLIIETKHERLEIPSTARREARVKNVKKGQDGIYRHQMATVEVLVPTLAGNVSDLNIDRMAKRWVA